MQPQEPITLEGCNTTKGCFRYPPDCYTVSACSYFLSWTVEGGRNKFEMAGDVGTYVAVGFSKSGAMVSSIERLKKWLSTSSVQITSSTSQQCY